MRNVGGKRRPDMWLIQRPEPQDRHGCAGPSRSLPHLITSDCRSQRRRRYGFMSLARLDREQKKAVTRPTLLDAAADVFRPPRLRVRREVAAHAS